MSTMVEAGKIRKALEETGHGWVLRFWGEQTDKYLNGLRAKLKKFVNDYGRRFPDEGKPDPFRMVKENPKKAAAFFHPDTFEVSIEMMVMIWRVLVGCEVVKVNFKYQRNHRPQLVIVLQSLSGEIDPPY